MKKVVLFILITAMFAIIGVTIIHALWSSHGPVAKPDFTGRLDVIKVYQWTPGPDPKIIYVKDLPASFYAVAGTEVGWKGRVVYGLQSSGTFTKPDGTTEGITNGEEGGTIGPRTPILTHEALDATSFTYRTHKSYSSRITEPTQSSTYTVNMTGHGLVKESNSSWKFDVTIQAFSLNVEYKSGQTVSFPMTEVSGSKSHTVGVTDSRPDAYECEHDDCEDALPRKDYHFRRCKEKVKGMFGYGEDDCDREYYICQTHTCDRPGEHLITGACGERILQKNADDHAVYNLPCRFISADMQTGNTVFCNDTGEFVCTHNHSYPSNSEGSDSGNTGNGEDDEPSLVQCDRFGCTEMVPTGRHHRKQCSTQDETGAPGCGVWIWTCKSSNARHIAHQCSKVVFEDNGSRHRCTHCVRQCTSHSGRHTISTPTLHRNNQNP